MANVFVYGVAMAADVFANHRTCLPNIIVGTPNKKERERRSMFVL